MKSAKNPVVCNADVLKRAVQIYGMMSQVDKTIEEMSELTKALLKDRYSFRNQMDVTVAELRQDIIEETADVYIMLNQIIMMYDCDDVIQTIINGKFDRLAKRLGIVDDTLLKKTNRLEV